MWAWLDQVAYQNIPVWGWKFKSTVSNERQALPQNFQGRIDTRHIHSRKTLWQRGKLVITKNMDPGSVSRFLPSPLQPQICCCCFRFWPFYAKSQNVLIPGSHSSKVSHDVEVSFGKACRKWVSLDRGVSLEELAATEGCYEAFYVAPNMTKLPLMGNICLLA